MTTVPQPRRPFMSNLRIAIWTSFLLVLVAPLLFRNVGQPRYAALLLRPGSWILARVAPAAAGDRGIVLVNFILYALLVYLLLKLLRRGTPT